jgi:hypothetical protein
MFDLIAFVLIGLMFALCYLLVLGCERLMESRS